MAKIYLDDIKLIAIRNKLFSCLINERQANLFDVITLSSGDYLPTQKLVDGAYDVYGGGGCTGKTHNAFNVEFGTFGIGRVGARCGCVFKINPQSWVTDNALFARKIDASFDIEFLIHFLNFKNINQYANTAAQPVISLKRISSITIPKIDLKRQIEIVDILNKIENGILEFDNDTYGIQGTFNFISTTESLSTELTHQVSLVKKLRQQLLQDAVQGKLVAQDPGDEPAGELLKRIKAEKQKLIKEGKLKKEKELPAIKAEEIPFEVPEGWVWCRLGEVGTMKRGKSKHRPRNDKKLFSDGTHPFIQTGDVARSKYTGYEIKTLNGYYNDFGLAQSEMQKKDTLCITIAANIAECGFLGFDACAPDSVVCFLSINKIIERYVFYFIINARDEIEKFAPATAQKNINLEILNSLLIPLPPLSEQGRIVQKLEELMGMCEELEVGIGESVKQNERLLQQVLREALKEGVVEVEIV